MPEDVPRFNMFEKYMNFKFHFKLFFHERCCNCFYVLCCRPKKVSKAIDDIDEDSDHTLDEAQVQDLLIENIEHVMANFKYNTSVKHFIDVNLRVQENSRWRKALMNQLT